jgi:hypothetical protein
MKQQKQSLTQDIGNNMAQVTEVEGLTHLSGEELTTLCGDYSADIDKRIEGELTCFKCAKMALNAIHLSTKTERKLWRTL